MTEVTFGSLAVGSTFTYQGQEYTKLTKVKISCCKFTNAELKSNTKIRVGLQDATTVQVSN